MAVVCPICGISNRDGATFCGSCGTKLSPPSISPAAPGPRQPPSVPPVASPPPAAAPPPPAYSQSQWPASQVPAGPQSYSPQPVAPQAPAGYPQGSGVAIPTPPAPAAAIATQTAKAAAAKSWEVTKQGMNLVTRLVTGGGRAAYTELFKPVPVIKGYVVSPPATASVPSPLEPAAFLFVAVLLLGWFILALPKGWIGALVLLVAWIGLLALNRLGVRRPFFSRLTLMRLRSLLGDKAKGQAQQVRFTVNNYDTNQPVDVVVVGARQGWPPNRGYWVQVWGFPDNSRNEVRGWQVEVVDSGGQRVGVYAAHRLMPLTVALFLPLTLVTLAFVVLQFVSGG